MTRGQGDLEILRCNQSHPHSDEQNASNINDHPCVG